MNLKQIIFSLLFCLLFSVVANAQQVTKADIQALEMKMISVITEMDKRSTKQIAELDKRLTGLQITVTEMDKRLTAQIQATQATMTEMDKRLSFLIKVLLWAISTLIGIVLAVIALPQLLGYFREKRARADFQKRIEELEQRLEQQQKEIEILKSQRLVMPSKF